MTWAGWQLPPSIRLIVGVKLALRWINTATSTPINRILNRPPRNHHTVYISPFADIHITLSLPVLNAIMPSPSGSGVTSPLLLPTHVPNGHHPSRPLKSHVPRARRWFQFFGTAIITGIVFHLVLVGLGSTEAVRRRVPTVINDWLPGGPKSTGDKITVVYEKPDCPVVPNVSNSTKSPTKTQAQKTAEEEAPWTIDRIREMVSHTNGYFGRDYSLGLGWNNVRVQTRFPL
jgi:hypothetical protein